MPAEIEEAVTIGSPANALLRNVGTLLLVLAALGLQWHAFSILFDSSLHGDAAKHYTSGVLVFDYLHSGLGSKPMPFAESFEVRYPLVGIGQWPPMYYVIQGLFYFVAGPSIRSAQILSALIAASVAFLVFATLRRMSTQTAFVAAAIFLATPLIQSAAWEVMSDLLTGFFVLLAIVAFARLLDSPDNWKAAAVIAVCSIAAVLSKGSAWALGLFFLIAPLLCRRPRFFISRWFIGSVLALILCGSIFYVVAARSGFGYPTRFPHYLSVDLQERLSTLRRVSAFAPPTLIAAGFIGTIIAFHRRWLVKSSSSLDTLLLTAAAWVLSQLLFLFILPMTPEPRVLTPSLAPLVMLAVCFLQWLGNWLADKNPVVAALAPLMVGAIIMLTCLASSLSRLDGFREAANAMPYPPDGALILVASNDWSGEEEVIAERLSHDPSHRDVILRGTHVLADVDADRKDVPLFTSPEAVRAYLLEMPVQFVVLGSPPYDFAFLPLIEKAVTDDPQDFHLIAQVPLVAEPGGHVTGNLRIFENPAGRDHHPSVVRTRLGSYAGRRILEYHWK